MSGLTGSGSSSGQALGPPEGAEQQASVLWRLRDVFRRGEQRPRLDGITMQIRDVPTAVIGYSGAGKTTLLNILAGYEQADSGVVERLIETVGGVGRHLAGGSAGIEIEGRMPLYWVPQDGGLWPHLTVRQHLLAVQTTTAGRRPGSRGLAGQEEKADEILGSLDLLHRKVAFPGEISEGERSRLSVARGLVSGARVLVMDEPLAHVDPVRKPGYWKMIREHSASAGTTLIFSCHEPEILLRHAERVVGLKDGRVWYSGTVGQLYANPPEADLGRFAGPLNWFSDEQSVLLGQSGSWVPANVAIRPEWLEVGVEVGTEGGLEVVRTQDIGWMTETEVCLVSERRLTVLHGRGPDSLRPGQKIGLRINRDVRSAGGTSLK